MGIPVSSTRSPDLAGRLGMVQGAASKSDTSSLKSMDCGSAATNMSSDQHHHKQPKKRASLPVFPGGQPGGGGLELGGCGEVVPGAVTMVILEGNVVADQLTKLQDEIGKLKVDKLELLRQNVAAQMEAKR